MRIMRFLKNSEPGQVLPIMALLLVAFMGLIGLAIDGGRLFVAKTELSRALDAAALAGVVELPDQSEAEAKAIAYMNENLSGVTVTFPASVLGSEFRVQGARSVDTIFMSVFGIGQVDMDATAAAGFGGVPIDTVLTIDATSSMGDGCNSSNSNSGCPIKEAKDAAQAYVDILLEGATTDVIQAAVVPYRGCYKPPRSYNNCVPNGWLGDLSSNIGFISAKISDINARGGSGTNICLGLHKSNEVIFGANAHTEASTLRFVLLLADGDNNYNSVAYGNGEPPVECRPDTNPSSSSGGGGCSSPGTQERELDDKTYEVAEAMKATDIEIFVVGFGVCGSSNSNACDIGMIGSSTHDNTADRNLLKCVASTEAHYFEVPTAEDLPDVFQQIAQNVSFRLVE